jgi:hypothetical protein
LFVCFRSRETRLNTELRARWTGRSGWCGRVSWVRAKSGFLAACEFFEPPQEIIVFVRLKIEDTRDGFLATISERDDAGKITKPLSIFLVNDKEEAKQRAKAVARGLGLTTYRVMDKSQADKPRDSALPERAQ